MSCTSACANLITVLSGKRDKSPQGRGLHKLRAFFHKQYAVNSNGRIRVRNVVVRLQVIDEERQDEEKLLLCQLLK